jgi:hypothetical protein
MITAIAQSMLFLYGEEKNRAIGSLGEISISAAHRQRAGERHIAGNRQNAWVSSQDIPRIIGKWIICILPEYQYPRPIDRQDERRDTGREERHDLR